MTFFASVAALVLPSAGLLVLPLSAFGADVSLVPRLYVQSSNGTVAPNLSDSYTSTQNADNKNYFASQIGGENLPDRNMSLTTDDVRYGAIFNALKMPDMELTNSGDLQVGLIPLPNSKDKYIVWIYVSSHFTKVSEVNARMALGIVKSVDSDPNRFAFVAEPIKNIQFKEREEIGSFFTHMFDLGVLGQTWAVSTIRNGCGAGGSICATTYLKLFSIQNDKLTIVFDEAVSYYGNYGGNWNPDGSRQHIVEETTGAIVVSDEIIDSIPVLLLQTTKGQTLASRRFEPTNVDENQYAYRSRDAEIIEVVE